MKFPADIVARLRRHYEGRPVCVTGGAGFIGGHLVDALLSVGASIVVLDDLSNSTLEHLASLIEFDPDRVRFVHGSILDDDAVADATSEARTIFHLAAMGSVPRSVAEPQRAWSVNATGTLRVLEAARRRWQGIDRAASGAGERLVFAASSSAYGDDPTLPKVESTLPRPVSPYAASKLAGEHLLSSWAHSYGLSTVSLRYFNVFGPRQPADSAYSAVIPAFAKRLAAGVPPVIYGDGKQSRDFTPVANAVLATMLAGAAERHLKGEVMNIGTGRRTTLLELAALLAQMMDRPGVQPELAPPRPGDVAHSLADISRARDLIGYTPIQPLEAGLKDTVAWVLREPARSDRA
jgi:nucleoside-diphosphate-sugar epimerase